MWGSCEHKAAEGMGWCGTCKVFFARVGCGPADVGSSVTAPPHACGGSAGALTLQRNSKNPHKRGPLGVAWLDPAGAYQHILANALLLPHNLFSPTVERR